MTLLQRALVTACVALCGCPATTTTEDDAGRDDRPDARPGIDASTGVDSGSDVDSSVAIDAYVPETDSGREVDAFAPEIDSGTDAGPPEVDSGTADAGLMPICMTDAECATGFCNHSFSFCNARGRCAVRPTTCAGMAPSPVCGCDGATYTNDCERQLAGVSLDYRSACDPPGPCPDITPRNCCFDDEDCSARGYPPLPFTRRCYVAGACGTSHGVCLQVPGSGRCWVDSDCAPGQVCDGAFYYTCGMTGTDPIRMGMCR
jgi:hypothetical protein